MLSVALDFILCRSSDSYALEVYSALSGFSGCGGFIGKNVGK